VSSLRYNLLPQKDKRRCSPRPTLYRRPRLSTTPRGARNQPARKTDASGSASGLAGYQDRRRRDQPPLSAKLVRPAPHQLDGRPQLQHLVERIRQRKQAPAVPETPEVGEPCAASVLEAENCLEAGQNRLDLVRSTR
jgi:hypothetical protein